MSLTPFYKEGKVDRSCLKMKDEECFLRNGWHRIEDDSKASRSLHSAEFIVLSMFQGDQSNREDMF